MKRDEILFLNQLIKSLEESEKRLETAYEKKEYENFNQSKRMMLRIQEEISKIIK
jgi:hypothetical protein